LDLQWQYGQAPAPSAADAAQAVDAPCELPPREELEALYQLARMGKINQMVDRIHNLEQQDASCGAFVEKLTSLAERYKIQQIQVLLKEYLDRDS